MTRSEDNAPFFVRELVTRVDRRLQELVGASASNNDLAPAIEYVLLAPGKRLRPLLCLMSAQCLGGRLEDALDPACAIEMVHTASLIVDDLPCMDDAEMRRGQASCHKKYGQTNTILVAFELLSFGYRVVSEARGISDEKRLQLVRVLARAAGISGLIGGQMRDLEAEHGHRIDTSRVRETHELKTGALFVAAAEAGGIVAGLQGDALIPVREYAAQIGLAYQTLDDLLDVQGTTESTGKDVGKDADKPTLVGALGQDAARAYADNMIAAAVEILHSLGPNMQPLENFVHSTLRHPDSGGRTIN